MKRQGADHEKMELEEKSTGWQNVKKVFGSDVNIWWLFPTDIPKTINYDKLFE